MSEEVISLTPEEVNRMLATGEMRIISSPGDVQEAEPGSNRVKLERAKEIFGEDFLGPEAVKIAFGIDLKPEFIPPIPFLEEELIRAKELNQFLILRAGNAADGDPLTMKKMVEILQPQFDVEDKGQILWMEGSGWYGDEEFFIDETPLVKWALVSKEVIPESTDKNYLEQTQLLADYLRNRVFNNRQIPEEYKETLEEFEREKDNIASLVDSDWQELADRLSELKLNHLTRHTMGEALYDILTYFRNTGKRLMETKSTWTISLSFDGIQVSLGDFDPKGVYVNYQYPDDAELRLGVYFSRQI